MQNFLSVERFVGTLYYQSGTTCGSGIVPVEDRTGGTGIADSDLVIYLFSTGSVSLSNFAVGGACAY